MLSELPASGASAAPMDRAIRGADGDQNSTGLQDHSAAAADLCMLGERTLRRIVTEIHTCTFLMRSMLPAGLAAVGYVQRQRND